MPVPLVFRKNPREIASYDYADIASGVGYIQMYAGLINTSYVLSNSTFYSDDNSDTWLGGTSNTNAYVKVIDADFDITLNKPMNLFGTAFFSCSAKVVSAAPHGYGYVVMKIRKYSGSTETEIANGTSAVIDSTGTAYSTLVATTAVTSTVIAKGDKLRLTVEGYVKNNDNTNNVTLTVVHDPVGRVPLTGWDTSLYPSIMLFKCPVRIDL